MRKAEEEQKAMDLCSQQVRDRRLPLEIVGAEYQFDRNKLTFYYKSEDRVDFRELVKNLYRVYRVRIWMQKVGGGNGSPTTAACPSASADVDVDVDAVENEIGTGSQDEDP